MTFEEVLHEWVARKLGKPIDPEDDVSIEWEEGSACDTCGYAGYVNVLWVTKRPKNGRVGARAWTYRDGEMIDLTKELVALALELDGARAL